MSQNAGTASPRLGRSGKRGRNRPKGRQVDPAALAEVRGLLGDELPRRDRLIEYLHAIQDHCGHLSAGNLVALADIMRISAVEVYEVASFYHHFDVVREGDTAPPALTVRVCDSVSCELAGAGELIEGLRAALGDQVRVQAVPCVGRCEQAPVAVVGQNPVHGAGVEQVVELVRQGATRDPGQVEHLDYAAYRSAGGYTALQQVADGAIGDEQVLNTLENAGLRGLGGAGFPAGRKWRILRDQPAPRLLAVNVDEGEPGTFKDRYYLERDPHRMLEGILIACRVVGIDSAYIYVRDEYPHVRDLLARAIAELRADPPVDGLPVLELRRGAGAYICGEESAMIESIEGRRGMPRLRPPYVAEVGLFGRPTLEHNAETLYWVRELLEKGADWFAGQGRHGRKGLRSFSVSGRVNKPGVHLAPAGITLRELIDEYCGGMLPGHELRAYFPGGASGGILPARLADEPLDFDTLQKHGCFIGSAAIMVLSDQDSVRAAALNAMRFFAHESCGKCTPCRVGTSKAAALMEQDRWDLELLGELAQTMEDASICGLGQAAPNPLRCLIRYFPEELSS